MLMFLLGALVSIVLGIIGNLLTPDKKALRATVASWGRRGVESQTRKALVMLQAQLDRLNRFKASDRDLYLYLFRWVLGIIASFVAAFACAFVVATSSALTPDGRMALTNASLAFLLFSLIFCVVLLHECGDYTVAGMQKNSIRLDASIAKLRATLPESRSN